MAKNLSVKQEKREYTVKGTVFTVLAVTFAIALVVALVGGVFDSTFGKVIIALLAIGLVVFGLKAFWAWSDLKDKKAKTDESKPSDEVGSDEPGYDSRVFVAPVFPDLKGKRVRSRDIRSLEDLYKDSVADLAEACRHTKAYKKSLDEQVANFNNLAEEGDGILKKYNPRNSTPPAP